MDNGLDDMSKATYCPLCRLREATKADTLTVPQGEDGGLCWARWGSGCPPRPRPASIMRGGETGDGIPSECGGWLHPNADNPEREPSWCSADEAL
jgi:hypothetical protein